MKFPFANAALLVLSIFSAIPPVSVYAMPTGQNIRARDIATLDHTNLLIPPINAKVSGVSSSTTAQGLSASSKGLPPAAPAPYRRAPDFDQDVHLESRNIFKKLKHFFHKIINGVKKIAGKIGSVLGPVLNLIPGMGIAKAGIAAVKGAVKAGIQIAKDKMSKKEKK